MAPPAGASAGLLDAGSPGHGTAAAPAGIGSAAPPATSTPAQQVPASRPALLPGARPGGTGASLSALLGLPARLRHPSPVHARAAAAVQGAPRAADGAGAATATSDLMPLTFPPVPPVPTPPPLPLLGMNDPVSVIDANKGLTLPTGVPINDFSTWSEDLRAQVSGATVQSYSWNLSQAPDATSVSGTGSYRLQFTWATFTGAARSDTITLTTTNTDLSQHTVTLTFNVAGTSSPAYASTPPTTAGTWASVITPDQLTAQQPGIGAGVYAGVGLTAGDVRSLHMFPDYNPGVDHLHLIYDSAAANPHPIFLVHYQLDPTQATAPPTVTAQLTLSGTAGSTIWYNTAAMNPGDLMQMALQGNATGLATGRYSWQITVTANYVTPQTTTYSGQVDIVNDASSPFGAGWSLLNVERLWPVSGGVILEEPAGLSLWFANGSQAGTFITPPGDFSTLSQNTSTGVYTRTLPDGTQSNFNSSGLQTSIVDRVGNTTSFGYTDSQLTSITDMNGLVTQLAYNQGLVSSITDPANRATQLAYTGSQLTSITDPDNGVWRYGYDAANDLTTLTDPRSANTTADTTTFSYTSARATGVTQPDNTTEALTPVELQGLPAAGTGTQTNPAAGVLAAAATGNFTDPRNNVWTTETDWLGFGTPTSQADPLGNTALTYRDGNGLPWLTADPLGRRDRSFFDSKGSPTTIALPDDSTWTYTYNGFEEPTQATNAGGQFQYTTATTYDSHGNATQQTLAGNFTYNYTYTSKGSVATATDPSGAVTTYTYDSRNRLTSVEDPLLNTTTYTYDNASDVTGVTNPLGFTTTFSYDIMGNLLQQTVPLSATASATTTFTYDAVDNFTSLKDPDLNTTTFAYDGMNRETASTDPLNHQTTYSYDAAGNLSAVTDRDGRQRTFTYDAADRETGEIWTNSSPAYSASYSYNAAGQVTSESDTNSASQFTYDSKGRLSTVSNSGTPGVPSVTLTYGYDVYDHRTSLTDTQNGRITYGYSQANDLSSISFSNANISLSYDTVNRLTNVGMSLQGGRTITEALSYDKDSRVTGITDTLSQPSTTLASFTYTYDGAGNVSGYTGPEGTLNYSHDRANELIGVTGARNESYSYDANGNRTMSGYSTATGNRLSSDGTYNYTYDNEGNVLTQTRISDGQVTTYTWDYRNRLTEVVVKTSGGTVLNDERFTYDVEGRRIGIWANGAQQSWTVYDGATPYLDFTGSGSLSARYIAYPGPVDRFFARVSASGAINWYLTDLLGSVRDIVSTSGAILDQVTYGSFGTVLSESNSGNGDRFKFAGGQYDSSLTLEQFWARYYAPATGRFLTNDPMGFSAGDPNLYRYVGNMPTNQTDPTGLFSVTGCLAAGETAGLIGGEGGFLLGGGPMGGIVGAVGGFATGCLIGGFGVPGTQISAEGVAQWNWGQGRPPGWHPTPDEVALSGFYLGIPIGIFWAVVASYGGPYLEGLLEGPPPPPEDEAARRIADYYEKLANSPGRRPWFPGPPPPPPGP